MSGRLVLVRHAESESNILQKLDTRPPGAGLTARGHEQASALAKDAQSWTCNALVSSIALRAQQTADPLSRTLGRELQIVEGIHEIQAGELEDRADREAHRLYLDAYSAWMHGDYSVRIPGGESGHDVLDRYLPVIGDLHDQYLADDNGTVVVVSHGAVIRLVAARLTGITPMFAIMNRLQNTGVVELQPTRGGWELGQWGQLKAPFTDVAEHVRDVMG
ncbi:histidine phosphatase family protein [Hoyosella subflava]|uniref:Putative phosphoglycerate mutase n=1 Tax=Hoyosella subflava (strain DSM 45089 / JCM 17490 / NBRC 109087 / DQS3-9A1) TaxID=443218 RepID=F6EE93_HOYSD|nr:histidine phosphatase family protein [Hoyosella subflava]AEF38545.1 putative phosphoglycerate mutase [Hoyosella subflava DQS3-9A1]